MIAPIPKVSTKDKHIPLNYWGISLLSVVSKLYSAVINNRFLNYLEDENLLVEEQNGFRRKRSCEDRVYSACTLIRNRLSQKKDTFGVFIDLKKKPLIMLIVMFCCTSYYQVELMGNFMTL